MKVILFGNGKIGSAFRYFLKYNQITNVTHFDKIGNMSADVETLDVENLSLNELVDKINSVKDDESVIVNAAPFFLVSKIAEAAVIADCHYIDFTEDDYETTKVIDLWKKHNSNKVCVPKCGLAPGFVNYLGHQLIEKHPSATTLELRVGALPRCFTTSSANPKISAYENYALTWNVDGLVNEYLNECKVKINGIITTIRPLTGLERISIDGISYEAANTSGGIGSLVNDVPNSVLNVNYKSIRYPGHYEGFLKPTISTLESISLRNKSAGVGMDLFKAVKAAFTNVFKETTDDVVIIYGRAFSNKKVVTKSFKIYGNDDLTAIQLTTAGSAFEIFKMIEDKLLKPGVNGHWDIPVNEFFNSKTIKSFTSK